MFLFLSEVIYSQTVAKTITFENRSGEVSLVKVIGPSRNILEVPNGQSRSVSADAGEYFILVRYGNHPDNYYYYRGDNFQVPPIASEASETTIILHKVIDGKYKSIPITEDQYNNYSFEERELMFPGSSSTDRQEYDSINPEQTKWLLFADKSNEDLIKMIGRYIDTFYHVTSNYIFRDEDKLVLTYDLSSGDAPKIRIYVEALAQKHMNYGGNVKLTDRRIKVYSFINISEYTKDKNLRQDILELNNKWLNEVWIPHSLTLTANGNIAMNSSVNIPGKDFPIPVECVRDLISGTLSAWENYSSELLKVINNKNN